MILVNLFGLPGRRFRLWRVFASRDLPFKVLHGHSGLRYCNGAVQLDLLNLAVDAQLGEVSPVAKPQASNAAFEAVRDLIVLTGDSVARLMAVALRLTTAHSANAIMQGKST